MSDTSEEPMVTYDCLSQAKYRWLHMIAASSEIQMIIYDCYNKRSTDGSIRPYHGYITHGIRIKHFCAISIQVYEAFSTR